MIGHVKIAADVFVGPLSVIRADQRGPDGEVAPIVIEAEVNIQDGVIIHSDAGASVVVWAANSRLRMDYLQLRKKAEAIRSPAVEGGGKKEVA